MQLPTLDRSLVLYSAVAVFLIVIMLMMWRLAKAFGWLDDDGLSDTSKALSDKSLKEQVRALEQDGKQQSLSDTQLQAIADGIYEAIRYSAFDDDNEEAIRLLKMMNTELDVIKLIQAYGDRQHRWFGVPWGGEKSLPEVLPGELSNAELREVNQHYQQQGIPYQF